MPAGSVQISRALDMRYVGQEHLVTVDVPLEHFERQDRQAIKKLFDHIHHTRYGTSAPGERAEIASLRTSVTGRLTKPSFEEIGRGGPHPPHAARHGSRPVWFGSTSAETPVYDRESLQSGNRISGPALIEEHASTTVLFPGDELSVDSGGNLVITVASA